MAKSLFRPLQVTDSEPWGMRQMLQISDFDRNNYDKTWAVGCWGAQFGDNPIVTYSDQPPQFSVLADASLPLNGFRCNQLRSVRDSEAKFIWPRASGAFKSPWSHTNWGRVGDSDVVPKVEANWKLSAC